MVHLDPESCALVSCGQISVLLAIYPNHYIPIFNLASSVLLVAATVYFHPQSTATCEVMCMLYYSNAVMWLRLVQSIVFRSCKTTRSVARKKINCVLALTANAKVASYYHHGTSLKPKLHKCNMQKFDFKK